ncbi:hypothetical protein [Achromobacter mucicolens]|nr:hypothetical protein [Achromobacter mucicolens]UAN04414.1 hypothetical protein K9D24_09870 [Achromobacter mucicolens]
MTRRNPEDDPIVDFILALGIPRFMALLAAACAASFCVAHRIASLIWS